MTTKTGKYKSWRQKLENPVEGLPKVVDVPDSYQKQMGGKRVLVPTPLLVDELMRKVPKRKLITTGLIRKQLAKKFKADSTCPMTLGIFLRISAETAEEDLLNGKNMSRARSRERITPYWRVVKDDGGLNPKFPGGIQAQTKRLRQEGHKIVAGKGKKPPKVKDFEKALV
jgi:hypothetical protein